MTKLALLKKVSFNVNDPNISQYLADKVTFYDFDGTINLFHKIHELIVLSQNNEQAGRMIEILNCDYDEQYLIQAFYLENGQTDVHENIVLVKRQINPNDNYVYATEPELAENDNFIHADIKIQDIEKILLRKFKNSGVLVKDDDTIQNINYTVTYNHEDNTGFLNITDCQNILQKPTQIKFINVPSIIKAHEKEELTPEQFSQLLSDKVAESGATYFYTQREFGLGLFNCFCPLFGQTQNNIITKLLAENAYGDSYIGLENHLNDDTRILPLDIVMLNKILKLLDDKNFKLKNGIFCNLFYELSDY